MKTKKFLFVCKTRNEGIVYLNSVLYDKSEFQEHMCHLDSIGVAVIDIIEVEVDLSKY